MFEFETVSVIQTLNVLVNFEKIQMKSLPRSQILKGKMKTQQIESPTVLDAHLKFVWKIDNSRIAQQ